MRCSIDGCGRAGRLTRGMCAKHYRYWLDHTPQAERPTAPRFQRDFWDSVRKSHENGCWRWTGATIRSGHGMWGRKLAHRFSWELANGPIPEGMWVLHQCDNAPCVNPRHLYLGTIIENTRDAVDRGKNYVPPRKTVCDRGHPIEGDNLREMATKEGMRRKCRECDNRRSREFQRSRRMDHGVTRHILTSGEKETIRALRMDGMSHRRIAAESGRSLAAVQRVLKEAGL